MNQSSETITAEDGHQPALPRLLADFTPLPGAIKLDCEDFVVEELPLYEPAGDGTHAYFFVEKRGLSTMQAISNLSRALGVRRMDIGYAGMKDARAVTRQWMSLEHVEPARIEALDLPRLRILNVERHRNKLRLGHLVGNRFVIKVRRSQPERLAALQDALAQLVRLGVPNYFGEQRFGARGDTWRCGRAIVRGELEEVLDLVLGRPTRMDQGAIRHARELYDHGKYQAAANAWPGAFRNERRALHMLAKRPDKKKKAFLAIDSSLRTLYVSAYQSHLFNLTVAARLPAGLHHLIAGDLAWLHRNEAVFTVEDPALEQPRADAFEISPTGPLFGYRMTQPGGAPGEMEAQLITNEGLTPESFRSEKLRVKGVRRPLRFQPTDTSIELGADARGPYLELRFSLPRGCYATALLRELFDSPRSFAGESGGMEEPLE